MNAENQIIPLNEVSAEKDRVIKESISAIIKALDENINREGIKNTPTRACRALQFLTKGYHDDISKIINGALFNSDLDEMVVVKSIEFYSLCEHHLLPFFGKCHVAYIPDGQIIGLSKIPRIVDMFARRLQVQENLTMDIAKCLLQVTKAKGVAVVMEAQHLCMMIRGIEKQNAEAVTSVMLGSFREDDKIRAEFHNAIKK
jgi:GTP cyclohydrolase IA